MIKEDKERDYVLWNLLLLTRDAMHKVRDKELKEYKITTAQAGILFAISSLGERATIAEIGSRMLRRPHSVSNLLHRLEKHGLVKTQKTSGWRNAATYTLTPEGQQAYENSTERKSLQKALSVLQDNEKDNLDAYLRKIMAQAFRDLDGASKPSWP